MNRNEKYETTRSKDGTTIAFERSGTGPAIVLIGAALSDRAEVRKLARLLEQRFTVVNYDRRGRGQSSDTLPYAIEREVEDIDALIAATGGSAYLFGSSSGSVLALEAAGQLGERVKGVLIYEPPFIVDDTRPPLPDGLADEVRALVSANRRSDAVRLFLTKGMGIPSPFVTLMRLFMPGWPKMARMAHTIPYDLALLAGTQSGHPLPVRRWSAMRAPALVMVGGKSEPHFHSGARALAGALPNVQYQSLAGAHHGSVVMAPKAIASAVQGFFLDRR